VAVSDHDHLAEIPDLAARPLLDKLGDRPMEQLVALDPRFEHVIADVPDGHGGQDGARGATVRPGSPFDQQGSPGVRVQSSGAAEQFGALLLR
jgi:hypothetical protein